MPFQNILAVPSYFPLLAKCRGIHHKVPNFDPSQIWQSQAAGETAKHTQAWSFKQRWRAIRSGERKSSWQSGGQRARGIPRHIGIQAMISKILWPIGDWRIRMAWYLHYSRFWGQMSRQRVEWGHSSILNRGTLKLLHMDSYERIILKESGLACKTERGINQHGRL